MPRFAFVTYAALPELSADDKLAADALRRRGCVVESVVWDSPGVRWDDFDGAIVRSCWDYHVRDAEFRSWIDAREAGGISLWNPPAVLRWNMDKRYLRELEARGLPVVATRWLERGCRMTLAAVLAEEGWDDAVIKPVLSASAHETWRVTRDDAEPHEARFAALLGRGGVMVQPFVPQVREEGEWSLLFFRGAFSHGVVKRPAGTDFRVQESFGGVARARRPPAPLLEQAQAVADAVPQPWLYARVDGCVVDGRFVLMELEMLEPSLYLAHDAGAAERFAQAVGEVVG